VNGIAPGYDNPRHLLRRPLARAAIRTAQVRLLAPRVSAHHPQRTAGGKPLVAHTGGNDDHVSRSECYRHSVLPAQLGHRRAAVNAEHLVGGAVVVMEGEDAVAPASDPVVGGEKLLAADGYSNSAKRGLLGMSPSATSKCETIRAVADAASTFDAMANPPSNGDGLARRRVQYSAVGFKAARAV